MPTRTRRALLSIAVAAAALSALLPGAISTRASDLGRAKDVATLYRFVEHPAAASRTAPVIAAAPTTVAPPTVAKAEAPPAGVAKRSGTVRTTAPTGGTSSVAPSTASDVPSRFNEGTGPPSATDPPPSSGPCPKAPTCKVYALQNARWKTDATGIAKIPWKFNDAGRRALRAPAGMLESALQADMAEWHRWNSNVQFVYSGTTTAAFGAPGPDGSCADGTNVIGWARFDPETIAETMICTDSTGRQISDVDMALNVTFHWEDIVGTPQSRHSFDIRSIVMHELGHMLSLAHPDPVSGLFQTMMANARYGETRKRTPALGDVLGLQKAYPCGKGDSCPIAGIADD